MLFPLLVIAIIQANKWQKKPLGLNVWAALGLKKGLLCFSIHKEQLYANVPPSLTKLWGKRLVRLSDALSSRQATENELRHLECNRNLMAVGREQLVSQGSLQVSVQCWKEGFLRGGEGGCLSLLTREAPAPLFSSPGAAPLPCPKWHGQSHHVPLHFLCCWCAEDAFFSQERQLSS